VKNHWLLRAELELPDVAVIASLPKGWRWSDVCFWVVNSDGVANDPQRRLVKRGGQLHTAPYRSPSELAAACQWVFRELAPRVNYRASMRIQVQVPGLAYDLDGLKLLCDYTRRYMPPMWPRLDPLEPLLDLQPDPLAAKAAHARLTATIRARHFLISARRHEARMNAANVREFTDCEMIVRADRKPAFAMPARESVDVRDIADGNWVTLRCFAQAREMLETESAAGFAQDWIASALNRGDPLRVIGRWQTVLPRQMPFLHRLELGWAQTNFHHNTRRTVAARLGHAGVSR
jgi:hypothetical protein